MPSTRSIHSRRPPGSSPASAYSNTPSLVISSSQLCISASTPVIHVSTAPCTVAGEHSWYASPSDDFMPATCVSCRN